MSLQLVLFTCPLYLTFFICCAIAIILSFISLIMTYFSSSNMFIMSILKFFLLPLIYGCSHKQRLTALSSGGTLSCFFARPVVFGTGHFREDSAATLGTRSPYRVCHLPVYLSSAWLDGCPWLPWCGRSLSGTAVWAAPPGSCPDQTGC